MDCEEGEIEPEVLFLLTDIFVQNSVEGAADPPTSEFFYVLKKKI